MRDRRTVTCTKTVPTLLLLFYAQAQRLALSLHATPRATFAELKYVHTRPLSNQFNTTKILYQVRLCTTFLMEIFDQGVDVRTIIRILCSKKLKLVGLTTKIFSQQEPEIWRLKMLRRRQ